MKNGLGFDNLDEISIPPDDNVQKGEDSAAAKQRREKLDQQFIKVPVPWIGKLAETKRRATPLVAMCLLRLSWKKDSKTVSLTNSAVEEFGVSRREKIRALVELKDKKLVTVESGLKKSPRVTLLLNRTS